MPLSLGRGLGRGGDISISNHLRAGYGTAKILIREDGGADGLRRISILTFLGIDDPICV